MMKITSMEKIIIGELTIDPERFLVYRNDRAISLTKTEFYILYLLMSNYGKIHSREFIHQFVLGKENLGSPRTIDVHISNIRKKIGRVNEKDVITVIRGVGYKLN